MVGKRLESGGRERAGFRQGCAKADPREIGIVPKEFRLAQHAPGQ